ncbi:MAG: hypothetical protein E5Y76_01690, partial [Mesorhizobium sp.]
MFTGNAGPPAGVTVCTVDPFGRLLVTVTAPSPLVSVVVVSRIWGLVVRSVTAPSPRSSTSVVVIAPVCASTLVVSLRPRSSRIGDDVACMSGPVSW